MPAGVVRAVLMAVAGLCLVIASLALVAPSVAFADTAHQGARAAWPCDAPARDSTPTHGNACCAPAAACPLMHVGLPATFPEVPPPSVRAAEPAPAAPALRGFDRPPPLPPPRASV